MALLVFARHGGEIRIVMIEVAGEQLVRRRAAHRDLVASIMDRLHESPLRVVGDRVDRRVMGTNKSAKIGQKVRGFDRYGGVPQAEFAHFVMSESESAARLILAAGFKPQ